MDPRKRVFLVFCRKPPQKMCSWCFSLDSALKTLDPQMFFWSVFLKKHKKSYWPLKTPFWPFLAVNNVFLCIFKNTVPNNTCVSIVFKLKQKKNMKKYFFYGFYFKTQKCSFWGVQSIFFLIWIWTSKIISELWLVDLFWPIKKKFHTPP